MDLSTFRTGSILHFACLIACGLMVLGLARIAKRHDSPDFRRRLRWFVAGGCLVFWLINTVYWMWPSRFHWAGSLPLHFCNLANLIGAIAVFGRSRLFKAVLYFWAFALCIWAFLTPVLSKGPARPEFWVFWGYHLFILLALVEVLVVQRFRPNWNDCRNVWLFTIVYTGILAILDYRLEWQYGFVGPSTPENPTLLDVLGPYPLRLLWMILIATALFGLLLLPWRGKPIR
jgi:hypothetical integral membrane protein (TIGR02206 family)